MDEHHFGFDVVKVDEHGEQGLLPRFPARMAADGRPEQEHHDKMTRNNAVSTCLRGDSKDKPDKFLARQTELELTPEIFAIHVCRRLESFARHHNRLICIAQDPSVTPCSSPKLARHV